jgi:hypothetical protein
MASAQVVVAAFAVSFASIASGMLIGYSLRPHTSFALEQPPPPIEPGITVDAPTLVLRTATPKASPSYVRTHTTLRRAPSSLFFDFKRAVCDEAESVRGVVLRCSYAHADRR